MDNEEVKVLASSEPFEGRHASGFFFLALGAIALGICGLGNALFEPESTGAMVFMFTGAIVFLAVIVLYTLDYKATVKHMAEILNAKFKFTPNATLDDVYNKIEPALKNIHGEKVKIARESDCVAVTYEGITYKIILGDDAIFSVRWQKSFLDKALALFANIVDRENEAEPTWKYDKIRTATPIIAYELQRAFGVTENFSSEQTIEEIYRKKKFAAVSEQNISVLPKKTDTQPGFFVKHKKKILAASVVFAGLILITASLGNSTPKTLDQFVEQYNTEIKRTAKDSTLDNLAKECTLDKNNFSWNDAGKAQSLFYDNIYFYGWDSSVDRMSDNPGQAPVSAHFSFYYDPPASAVFAVIRAAISAAGDDEEKVAKRLGILQGDRYTIPYGYDRKINFNGKEYLINSSDSSISFSIRIPTR